MNNKAKSWVPFVAIALTIITLCGIFAKPSIMLRYDSARLAQFAHRIAETDRVIGTWDQASLTLTGGDSRKVVQAVSSAVSARIPNAEFACIYSARAAFYRGTNFLGDIYICEQLFVLKFDQPPFFSEELRATLYQPLREALRESYQTNDGSK